MALAELEVPHKVWSPGAAADLCHVDLMGNWLGLCRASFPTGRLWPLQLILSVRSNWNSSGGLSTLPRQDRKVSV